MSNIPGTVSKILWHFTGGPAWDSVLKKQSKVPKSEHDAYKALCGILKDRKLLKSRYNELIPDVQRIYLESGIELERVCCIADIPIQHLSYHGKKYGRFAIGFTRKSVIEAKFNPVSYATQNSLFGEAIYGLIHTTGETDFRHILFKLSELEIAQRSRGPSGTRSRPSDVFSTTESLVLELAAIAKPVRQLLNNVKVLDDSTNFDEIYCEREWRLSGRDFDFKIETDVAMILLPKSGDKDYYHQFIDEFQHLIPRDIPIVSWEDLIEH